MQNTNIGLLIYFGSVSLKLYYTKNTHLHFFISKLYVLRPNNSPWLVTGSCRYHSWPEFMFIILQQTNNSLGNLMFLNRYQLACRGQKGEWQKTNIFPWIYAILVAVWSSERLSISCLRKTHMFSGKDILHSGDIPWPPKLPDLSTWDFY